MEYTPQEIADVSEKIIRYWVSGDSFNRATLEQNKYEIWRTSQTLIESIKAMMGIPEEIRNKLTMVRADDKTLETLEKICQKNILDCETPK
jgi:DNA-binding Xre family transcriptional regulator